MFMIPIMHCLQANLHSKFDNNLNDQSFKKYKQEGVPGILPILLSLQIFK